MIRASLALLSTALLAAFSPLDAVAQGGAQADADDAWAYLLKKYDANKDGVLTRKEYTRDDEHWKNLDVDGSGKVDKAEFTKRGWNIQKEKLKTPKKGAKAPDFKLAALPPKPAKPPKPPKKDGKEQETKDAKPEVVQLSSFQGKKPVALIFGSYT